MTTSLLAIALLFGGAALAAWVQVRFPRLGPADWRILLLHLIAVVLVLNGGMQAAMRGLVAVGTESAAITAALGVALPALVYAFLIAIWSLLLTRRMLDGSLK